MPVNSTHPEYQKYVRQWIKTSIFFEGETAVKDRGELYLPRPENMKIANYNRYKTRAFFFNAAATTAEGMTGVVMRKAPLIELPSRLKQFEKSIDNQGNSIRAFAKICLNFQFNPGRYGIYADHTQLSEADGGRPYLVAVRGEDIINWKQSKEGRLEFVVIRETYERQNPSDLFLLSECVRYRVLALDTEGYYYQQVYESLIVTSQIVAGKYVQRWNLPPANEVGDPVYPKRRGKKLSFIPFVFCNVSTVDAAPQRPPLIDLVDKNAELYRVGADYANALYFTGNPIIWGNGIARDNARQDFVLSSADVILLENENSTLHILEYNGHGLNPSKERWNAILDEMAKMGSRLLEQQTGAAETAQAVVLRRTGEVSVLTQMVIADSTAIYRALSYMNYFAGGELEEEFVFGLNMDFSDVTMDANTINALVQSWIARAISYDTLYEALRRGELTREGVTAEQEQRDIEKENPLPDTGANNDSSTNDNGESVNINNLSLNE